MTPAGSPSNFLISAGESSGDRIAADLVQSLRALRPDLHPFGVAGPEMRRVGVSCLVRQESLAVMGFAEVLRHLPTIKEAEAMLLESVKVRKVEFAVLVDYPGFHMRLAEQLRMLGIPVWQYVAPQLWAWGAGRVEALRANFRGVLGVVPFEEEFFKARDVPYTFVGSPIVDRVHPILARPKDRVEGRKKRVGLFPGSRLSEWRRMAAPLLRLKRVLADRANLDFYWSVAPALDRRDLECEFADVFAGPSLEIWVGSSLELMRFVDFAVMTSGTATLECALVGTPMVILYRMNPWTFALAQRWVKVPAIGLANLVAGERVFREFVQDWRDEDVAACVEEGLATLGRYDEPLARIKGRLEGGAAARAAGLIVGGKV